MTAKKSTEEKKAAKAARDAKKVDAPKDIVVRKVVVHWQWRWNKSSTDALATDDYAWCVEEMINWCKEYCADWGFQLEAGSKTGMEHYQGYFRLVAKHDKPYKLFPAHWKGGPNDLDPTTDNMLARLNKGIAQHYATKSDTRIAGPWTNETADAPILYECYDIAKTLNPLQKTILAQLKTQTTRQILLVHGATGCVGKSTLGYFLHATMKNVVKLPPTMESAEDMLQWCYQFCRVGKDNQALIILDVPRACSGQHSWAKFNQALECIKGGHLYDKRYKGVEKMIYPPKILVFANTVPPAGMTLDRYVKCDVQKWVDAGLIAPYVPPEEIDIEPGEIDDEVIESILKHGLTGGSPRIASGSAPPASEALSLE